MKPEFSPEEINQVFRAARVWAPGLSEDQLRSLVNSQHRLADSGFCETAWGVVRLEQEKGIHCAEVLDACEQLLTDRAQLEAEVAKLQEKLVAQQDKNQRAEEEYRQLKEATAQVKEELSKAQAERGRQEKKLSALRKKAEKEETRIDKEVADYRQRANVTEQDIVTAGRLKAEVESHGFTLNLALALSQEFAKCESPKDELAQALEQHGTLTKSNGALTERQQRVKSDLAREEAKLEEIGASRQEEEVTLFQIRTEIANNRKILDFYHRYLHLQPLIEYLGGWPNVTFHHCSWCGAFFWILRPGNVRVTVYRCPWCGLALVDYDRRAYEAVGQPPGAALKLIS